MTLQGALGVAPMMLEATLVRCALLALAPGPAPAPAAAPEVAAAPAPAPAAEPEAATPGSGSEAAPDSPGPETAPAETAPRPDAPAESSVEAPDSVVEADAAPVSAPAPAPGSEPVSSAAGTGDPATPAEPPIKDVPFDIGLFPSVSINGKYSGQKIRNSISLGLLWNRSDLVEGVSLGLGASIVDERLDGLQLAFGANINRGQANGIQSAFGFNSAQQVRGIQVAHGFNWAKKVDGAQFALVNAAGRVRGVQFGLVNVADEADASLALIPITRKGGIHPEVFTSDTAMVNVGFRLPANYTYMFAAVGLHPLGRNKDGRVTTGGGKGRAWEAGLGYGGHIPVNDSVFVDIDLSGYVVTDSLRWSGPIGSMTKLRLLAGWQIAERFTVWGGPTLNMLVDEESEQVDRPGYGWIAGSHIKDDVRVRVWPGFAGGLRF